MNLQNTYSEKLFSYGTLQYEAVQLSTFGRKLNGAQDVLTGYHLSHLEINDHNVVETSGTSTHPILIYTGKEIDKVTGIVFDVSQQELQQADQYEVDEYKRVCVQLDSKTHAWVYVSAK
jgi:gamma-glutamylcyclotransferase (GGCT)/AIG2-like uncharacterized protein YtfP